MEPALDYLKSAIRARSTRQRYETYILWMLFDRIVKHLVKLGKCERSATIRVMQHFDACVTI